jgi:prepilin-type processing-associated H-X9-DG protein
VLRLAEEALDPIPLLVGLAHLLAPRPRLAAVPLVREHRQRVQPLQDDAAHGVRVERLVGQHLVDPAATPVQAHAHLLNTDTDEDGGLDDFSSRHPGGGNFVFADGSVRFLKTVLRDTGERPDGSTIYSPSSLVFQALATRNGGEVISADAY